MKTKQGHCGHVTVELRTQSKKFITFHIPIWHDTLEMIQRGSDEWRAEYEPDSWPPKGERYHARLSSGWKRMAFYRDDRRTAEILKDIEAMGFYVGPAYPANTNTDP